MDRTGRFSWVSVGATCVVCVAACNSNSGGASASSSGGPRASGTPDSKAGLKARLADLLSAEQAWLKSQDAWLARAQQLIKDHVHGVPDRSDVDAARVPIVKAAREVAVAATPAFEAIAAKARDVESLCGPGANPLRCNGAIQTLKGEVIRTAAVRDGFAPYDELKASCDAQPTDTCKAILAGSALPSQPAVAPASSDPTLQ